jgi:hypothetical protein
MRKAQEFVVYPHKEGENVTVQSDKAIGRFDPATGAGLLNAKGSGAKYFVDLNPAMGAIPYQFPAEFVKACMEAAPKKGDKICGVMEIG